MEKDRSARIIAIAALFVGVLGLSIGFSAFSNQLIIKPNATVTVDPNEFRVVFSTKNDAVSTESQSSSSFKTIEPDFTSDKVEESSLVIDNKSGSVPRISTITANFSDQGQKVVYKFYALNNGKYNAFLKGITVSPITEGASDYMTCEKVTTNDTDATEELVKKACEKISLKVKVDDLDEVIISSTATTADNQTTVTSSVTNSNETVTQHELIHGDISEDSPIGASHLITVTIEYAEGAEKVDGDFKVTFGDINLLYSSVD